MTTWRLCIQVHDYRTHVKERSITTANNSCIPIFIRKQRAGCMSIVVVSDTCIRSHLVLFKPPLREPALVWTPTLYHCTLTGPHLLCMLHPSCLQPIASLLMLRCGTGPSLVLTHAQPENAEGSNAPGGKLLANRKRELVDKFFLLYPCPRPSYIMAF